MRKFLDDAMLEIGKVDSMLYAYEQVYLDVIDDDDFDLINRKDSCFYAIWDSVKKAKEMLERLSNERIVFDAVALAAERKCENCTLKKEK